MGSKSARIIHLPFGNGQPYYQQPFERMPRMPIEGEPILLGMVADPMDGLETAELLWSVDGKKTVNHCDCLCIGNSDSIGNSGCERSWLASLAPIEAGGTLEYRFRGRTGHELVESEWFSCVVGRRYSLREVIAWAEGDGWLKLICATTSRGTASLRFMFEADALRVRCELDTGGDEGQGPRLHGAKVGDRIPEELTLRAKDYELRVATGLFGFRLLGSSGTVLLSSSGPVSVNEQFAPDGRDVPVLSMSFDSPEDEGFYGFGERYNRLNQRGELVCNRVFEQYKNQKLKTYLPVPFFFTNRNWGLLIDTNRLVEFDLAARSESRWSLSAELVGALDLRFFFGHPKSIIKAYLDIEGRAELPPDWAFGPWMSSNEWNSQARVQEVVRKTRELDIPASVLVIEAWSDETTFYAWNGAKYPVRDGLPAPALADFSFPEDGLWPDPKAMVDGLHDEGIKLILWQIPVVKHTGSERSSELHRRDEAYVREHDLILRESDGEPYRVRPGWFRGSMMIDFALPEAREWWFSRRRYLIEELGVDGFKTDGGEHIWGYEVYSPSGLKGDELINVFPRDYLRGYTMELQRHKKDGFGILFSRAGYRGAHLTPMHWAGDQDSSWSAYRGVLYSMLNANLSGVSFIGWDIGGFTGPLPTVELYLRSAAMAVFSPLMQYHSEFNHHRVPNVDRTPWNMAERWGDERAITVYRFFAQLRMALLPYIREEAKNAALSGEPFMRPLFLDWPEDERSWSVEDQYLFGRNFLIAPILEEGREARSVYLPAGAWTDVWTGELIEGPAELKAQAGLDAIPVYLRSESLPAYVPGPDVFAMVKSRWI